MLPSTPIWTITRAAFVEQARTIFQTFDNPLYREDDYLGMAATAHEESVLNALFEGLPVPPEVKRDYEHICNPNARYVTEAIRPRQVTLNPIAKAILTDP